MPTNKIERMQKYAKNSEEMTKEFGTPNAQLRSRSLESVMIPHASLTLIEAASRQDLP
jgi:hypothetical protein